MNDDYPQGRTAKERIDKLLARPGVIEELINHFLKLRESKRNDET